MGVKSLSNLYHKVSDFFDKHLWILVPLCILILFPLCFYLGYSVSTFPEKTILNGIPLTEELGHTNPKHVNRELIYQINMNDSLFSIKTANQDSIVFDRINKKLVHTAKKEFPTEDYSIYVGKNAFQMFLLGAMVLPTWSEVKSLYDFSTISNKALGVCLMAAGYLGFNQGRKCKLTNITNESWTEWLDLQEKLHDEKWWVEFAEKYPYYKEDYIIAEDHCLGAGIGVGWRISSDAIVVTEVEPDGPADRAGILEGDKILYVDGERQIFPDSTDYLSVFCTLRGPKDSHVYLGVMREGSSAIGEFIVKREVVPIPYWMTFSLPENVIE